DRPDGTDDDYRDGRHGRLHRDVDLHPAARDQQYQLTNPRRNTMETKMKKALETLLKPLRERAAGQDGFTLTEMLIVIALIGMVMAFVGSNLIARFNDQKVSTTKIQMKALGGMLDQFR